MTCLAVNPNRPAECVSGGRDGALLFWDRRQPGSAGPALARPGAAGGGGPAPAATAAYRTIANLHVSEEQRASYAAAGSRRGATRPSEDFISKTVTSVLYTHDE